MLFLDDKTVMKRLGLFLLTILVNLSVFAQNDNPQRMDFSPEEYWKNLQEAVTKDAQLTDSEVEAFFPLLKEMMGEQRKNNSKSMEILRSVNQGTTEAEYGTKVKQLLELDVQNRQIEENYYKKFHTVLSWEKVFRVRGALWRFNREALNRYRPHHRGQGPRPHNP